MSLTAHLTVRQRAMLAEMGIRLWDKTTESPGARLARKRRAANTRAKTRAKTGSPQARPCPARAMQGCASRRYAPTSGCARSDTASRS